MKSSLVVLLVLASSSVSHVLGNEAEHPLLPADTSSPRATLQSFVENCNAAYDLLRTEGRATDNQDKLSEVRRVVQRIMRCMDLSKIAEFRRSNEAKEAAVSLKEVLDRIELPAEKDIPDREAMTTKEGELLQKWTIPYTEITLSLVKEGPMEGSYQFSADTISRAKEYYQRVQHLPYKAGATENLTTSYLTSPGSKWLASLVKQLPAPLRERRYGQEVWQWIGLVVVLSVASILLVTIYYVGRRVSRGGAQAGWAKYMLGLAFPILALFVPLRAHSIIADDLVISGYTLYFLKFNLMLILLLAGIIVIMGIGRRVGELMVSSPHISAQGIDAQLIRVMSRIISMIASMVLLLEGGKHLGIPPSSLLAGAGVVGMALALSSQDALKNIFGSIMIALDKPFIVGERIKIKEYDGFVEEIGLRSTRVRLLNGHQVVIPNEDMARSDIDNISRRPFIRRVSDIPLSLNISAVQAAKAVDIVKEILRDHEGYHPDYPPRVWLNEFERDHLSLRMIYWYHPPNYWKYTVHAGKVSEAILQAFAKAGIEINVPAFAVRLDNPVPDVQPPPCANASEEKP